MVHNQIVKAINAHFSNVAIPHQIAMLEQRTRELKALSLEILNLAKQAKERLRIEELDCRPTGSVIGFQYRIVRLLVTLARQL